MVKVPKKQKFSTDVEKFALYVKITFFNKKDANKITSRGPLKPR